MALDWSAELAFRLKTDITVCGCDEAGRGPLAGPVVAAAVVLPEGIYIEGLDDSKKLSEKKRELLYDTIRSKCIDCAIEHTEIYEIEKINILNSSMAAMNRAVNKLSVMPDLALIDGNIARNFPCRAVPVIKGDSICPSIAAASVLAKVARDRFIKELAKYFPEYGLDKHKGYATKDHYAALEAYGISQAHRKSFLKKILNDATEH